MIELLLTILAVVIVLALIYWVLGVVGIEEKYKIGVVLVILLFVVLYLLGIRIP